MKYNFNLRPLRAGLDKKTPRLIYLVSYFIKDGKKQKFVYSTGFKVVSTHWDDKGQRVRNVVAATDSQTINNYLNSLSIKLNSLSSEMTAQRQPLTPQYLKERLDEWHNKGSEQSEPMTFLKFVEDFIKESETKTNVFTNKTLSPNTLGDYKTALKHLKDFNKRYKIDFKTLNQSFYDGFTRFLEKKPMKANTIGKYIKTLKTFIRAAELKGIEVSQDYKNRSFKVQKEDVENVYLSERELNALYELDLKNSPRLEKVRDLFLVGCFTGLRFSDFTNIKPQNIKTEIDETGEAFKVIRLETIKTGVGVTIPIHKTLLAILEKYDNNVPKSISNQKMNDYLKELCQLAGFIDTYEIRETIGGKRIVNTFEKWQLITTHTARRSFATNQYKNGVPSVTIRQITGHKTETAFLKYIKVTADEHAKIMYNHWKAQSKTHLKAV